MYHYMVDKLKEIIYCVKQIIAENGVFKNLFLNLITHFRGPHKQWTKATA